MIPQFDLSSDALPPAARVRAVRGTERLSRPYAFDLVLELAPGALEDLDAPVGKPATVAFNDEQGNPRDELHGILAALELVDAQSDRELYLARLVPRLWWLGQNRHSRIFVDEKLPTILDRVLRSAGWGDDDFRLVLKGRPGRGFPVLEHVCQYRESDLDFLSRWMEREGIYSYFEEGPGGRERLVVTDDAEAHKKRVAGARAFAPRTAAGGDRVEGFRSFRRTSHAQPAGVRLADYNYLTPDVPVEHQEKVGDGQLVSVFGDNLLTPDEARWLAKIRMQELRAGQVTYRGVGRIHGLHPADRFSLDDHPRITEDLLATEVVHRGLDLEGVPGLRDAIADALGEELDDGYSVEVTAIPASVQYRPPRVTPTPRITGMESAVVDGAANDRYAQLDEHGRYNVRFKFDESDLEDGRASTRVRMVQPHGGAEEGFHFPLRKGTEVMVAFLGGDPDRPVIVGVTPNPRALSPVTRANATQNVIQTGGGNMLVMEDTAGAQSVRTSSPALNSYLHLGAGGNNLELSTDGVGRIHTGSDLTVDVGGKRTDHVVQDLVENYDASQTTTVKKRAETVKGPVTEEYQGLHQQTVTQGGVLREVNGLEIETIKDGRMQTISQGLNQTIKGGLSQTVVGAQTLTHQGKITQTVTGGVDQTATTGDVTLKVPAGSIKVNANGEITITSSTAITMIAPKATSVWPDWLGHSMTKLHASVLMGNYATLALNGILTKIEVHGLRMDATKVQITNTPLKLQDVKMRIAAGALVAVLTKFTILGR